MTPPTTGRPADEPVPFDGSGGFTPIEHDGTRSDEWSADALAGDEQISTSFRTPDQFGVPIERPVDDRLRRLAAELERRPLDEPPARTAVAPSGTAPGSHTDGRFGPAPYAAYSPGVPVAPRVPPSADRPAGPPASRPGHLAVWALGLAVCSILTQWTWFVGISMAAGAIACAIIAIRRRRSTGLATTGLVIGGLSGLVQTAVLVGSTISAAVG